MSTRSRIAVMQETGEIRSIYCHYDGSPKSNGQTLLTYYNTEGQANELINLGNLSSLHENLNPLPEAPARFANSKGLYPILTRHTFDRPQANVTTAYHRDRKSKLIISEYLSLKQYMTNEDFEDYNYLWMSGAWHVKDGEKWLLLTQDIVANGIPSERKTVETDAF